MATTQVGSMDTGFNNGMAAQQSADHDNGIPSVLSSGRLYVGNLSWAVAWQDLKDYFKQCGNVLRADIMTGSDGRSKGCGLVEFETVDEAMKAINTLNDTELKGRQIFVREDRERPGEDGTYRGARRDGGRGGYKRGGGDKSNCVYVGNLPWDVSWHTLKDHFREHGIDAPRVDVEKSANGRSKGFGLVKFESREEANAAVEKIDGTSIGGRQLAVRLDRDA